MRKVLKNTGDEAKQRLPESLKIGDVARITGVGIEALRFYEKSGLLGRPGRTQSGYRVFNSSVLQRLDFIKRSQLLGFTLEEIKRIIGDKEAGRSPCLEVREIVRQRLSDLDEHIRELRRHRRDLGVALSKWEVTGELDGHVCGLIEETELNHPSPLPRTMRRRKVSRKDDSIK